MATQNDPGKSMSIKGLFQGLIPDPVSPLQGKVTSTSPLKIQVDNDEKLTLNASILIVPKHLSDYQTTVDISQGDGTVTGSTATDGAHKHDYDGNTAEAGTELHAHAYQGETAETSHSHSVNAINITGATMTVYNALRVGDKVHLLSLNNAKKYYILDRVV